MTYCFKDKERRCDDNCEAYTEDERNDTHCLDLATRVQVGKNFKDFINSNDLNSFFINTLCQAMDSFKETFHKAFK